MSDEQLPALTGQHGQAFVTNDGATEIPVKVNTPARTVTSGRSQEPPRLLFNPPIDIFHNEQGLVLQADLPGVTIDTLELQIQDAKLTLFARVQKTPPPDAIAIYQEYQVGDFLRSFILTEEIDYEKISAKLNHGVLEIVLPKAAKSPPRIIQVRTE